MARDVRGSCMEEETWRGREGVVGCGRYFRLRMGSLGRGGVLDQVLPPSKLENQAECFPFSWRSAGLTASVYRPVNRGAVLWLWHLPGELAGPAPPRARCVAAEKIL